VRPDVFAFCALCLLACSSSTSAYFECGTIGRNFVQTF
jgi:hypothetical protein